MQHFEIQTIFPTLAPNSDFDLDFENDESNELLPLLPALQKDE